MKRFLIITAVAALLALILTGCTGKTQETVDTDAGTEAGTVALTEEISEPICLISGNTTYYKMIRPDDTSSEMLELYKTVMKCMKNGGCTLYSGSTDWYKEGTDITTPCELLLGYTNRPESRSVMEGLSYNDFAIQVVNNKIVVAAHNEAKITEAVNYLCENLIEFRTENGVSSAYLTGTYISRGEGYGICGKDASIADYKIIYATGSKTGKDDAEKLQAAILKKFGVTLELQSEIYAKEGREIVVGNVDRDICRKFADKTDYNTFVCAADSGDLVIMGSMTSNTTKAVTSFIKNDLNTYYSYNFVLAEDYYMSDTIYTYSTDPARQEGTDFRIMSYNILCELWDKEATIPGRDSANYAVIKYYAPDVVGLQEVSDNWYTVLLNLFGDEYKFTDTKNSLGETNFSTLAYNTNTLTLLDHGVKVFSEGNNTKLRLATWGYFEIKSSGKRFVAMSTHWDLGKNLSYQMVHSNEMAALALKLANKYECEVVTTGDYNSSEETDPYTNFVDKTGYQDAKHCALKTGTLGTTAHSLNAAPGTGASSIDHIFGSKGVSFLFFNTIKDEAVLGGSDHCPIYADVKLK